MNDGLLPTLENRSPSSEWDVRASGGPPDFVEDHAPGFSQASKLAAEDFDFGTVLRRAPSLELSGCADAARLSAVIDGARDPAKQLTDPAFRASEDGSDLAVLPACPAHPSSQGNVNPARAEAGHYAARPWSEAGGR
jgi:hypothetical protein